MSDEKRPDDRLGRVEKSRAPADRPRDRQTPAPPEQKSLERDPRLHRREEERRPPRREYIRKREHDTNPRRDYLPDWQDQDVPRDPRQHPALERNVTPEPLEREAEPRPGGRPRYEKPTVRRYSGPKRGEGDIRCSVYCASHAGDWQVPCPPQCLSVNFCPTQCGYYVSCPSDAPGGGCSPQVICSPDSCSPVCASN
ncbi:MAG: hypothetical protein D6675_10955 [Gemmatimonadetes bacterium]|nr:MAG: hypothetical protein D6675_10955 [Gemmatimonadota bacterium]